VNHGGNFSHEPDESSRVFMELSSVEMEILKADMELSKAEESEGRLEAVWDRSMAIKAIAPLLLLAVAAGAAFASISRKRF
jgi:hypothetical protein